MKIGIYDPYLDDLGGGEKYMMTVAECLAKDHSVDIFWDAPEDFAALQQRFSLNVGGIHLKKNIFSPTVSLIDRMKASKAYDSIIVLSDGSIPLVLSRKLFLHIQQPLASVQLGSWKQLLKRSRVTGIFYNSEFTKSFNEQLFHAIPQEVIYPPVDLHQKKIAKENIILHVGRFRVKNVGVDDYKKQGVMINAFKQMVDAGLKRWKFIIAASVKKEDEGTFHLLQQSAEGYPVEFLINENNEGLWETLNSAKIYWHASGYGEDVRAHPEYAEHFGISTVEAMGAGAVPIVVNSGGQKEIVTDGVDGFLWNTIDELQAQTKIVMDDESVRKRLSEKAQIRAKDFSKKVFCEKITALVR